MKLRDDRQPSDETRKEIQAVINPQGGIYSGMTKRLAISDGSNTPVQNMPRGKAKKG